MATFEYNALTPAGRLMKGTLEAASRDEADALLQQMQLTVHSLEKARAPRPQLTIGRNEFLLFNQQLASLTKAGLPLERGLRELAADVTSRRMQRLITAVAGDLEAGDSIEQAFEKHQGHFPPLYGHILRAGVKTGRLSEMLTSLNRHLERASQTRRIIFEAMCYPAVVLALAAAVVTVIFMLVVPQLGLVLRSLDVPLPGITTFLLILADHALIFWAAVACLIGAVLVLRLILSRFPGGRRFKEQLVLATPILGGIYRRGMLSRMADAMATLVGAGCDLPQCFRLAASAAGSQTLVDECDDLAGRLEQGQDLLAAGTDCRMLLRLFLYSAHLGSQRNELQDNLYGLSEMYASQAVSAQARLQAALTPILIVFVGGVVGLTIVGLFAPLVRMLQAVEAV